MTVIARFCAVAVLALAVGCAAKPLRTQDFQGDVAVGSLVVTYDEIDPGYEDEQESGIFDKVRQAKKALDEPADPFDDAKRDAANVELAEFQEVLVARIAARTGLPLTVTPDTVPEMHFGFQSELSRIDFAYPDATGPSVDLAVRISYGGTSTQSASALEGAIVERRKTVKPKMGVKLEGTNTAGEMFWRESFKSAPGESYEIDDDFILSVSATRVANSLSYLIPLVEGL